MAKLKDLILAINGFANSNELSALAGASGIADIEVGEDTINDVNTKLSGLMSLEAAKNNPELKVHFKKTLHPELKGELLGNLDTDILQQTRSLFGEDAVREFDNIEFTGDKVKKVFELAGKMAQSKATDDKLKGTVENLRKQLEEATNNLNAKLAEKENQLKTAHDEFKTKLIRERFNGLMADYKLGEKFSDPEFKEFLSNKMYGEVAKKAHLTFNDETGAIVVKDPSDVNLDLYANNKKVESIKELLDPIMEPYVVKQPGNPKPGQQPIEIPRKEQARKLTPMQEDLIRQKEEMNL